MASKHHTDDVYRPKRIPKNPIKFKLQLNEEQKQAKQIILDNTITLLGGSAGSGKTLLACNVALDGLLRRQYDKIIITRPTVSKEEIGFLPGDLREKMDPWVQPIYQNFFALYDKVKIEKLITDGKIEIVPVSFMRGRTFMDSMIIVDEAQNVTHEQMEMITSRIGLRSKMMVCGDAHQTDLKRKADSGFKFLYTAARKIKNLEAITLLTNHRNTIVEDLLKYYDEAVDKGVSITTSGSYIYNSKN
jgi:phosphate starvation-inducible PhoH-like protein|tara:strand:- start:1089 stop:1826 length:738 start_codon:yes stop_codon:yes gene_type:complete